MNFIGQVPAESPTVLLIAIAIGVTLFLSYGFAAGKLSFDENEIVAVPNSRENYKRLEERVRDSWSQISQNNRFYLGAFIIGFGAQLFGQITDHPIFGSPIMISFTYLVAFTSCFKRLMNGRTLDERVIIGSFKGIQIEKEHPEWKADFFHRFVNKNYHKFGMFFLAFFRVIILGWMLFSVINFGIISRFEDQWSTLKIASISIAVFTLVALFLWRVGCHSYYLLKIKSKEVLS